MNPGAVKLISQLHGDEALDAMEKYMERLAICALEPDVGEKVGEEIALAELVKKVKGET